MNQALASDARGTDEPSGTTATAFSVALVSLIVESRADGSLDAFSAVLSRSEIAGAPIESDPGYGAVVFFHQRCLRLLDRYDRLPAGERAVCLSDPLIAAFVAGLLRSDKSQGRVRARSRAQAN
jgi:hypothetical protein